MHKLLSLVLVSLLFVSATCENMVSEEETYIYRERMISFVDSISKYAKEKDSDFIVIPQNGIQLLTESNQEIVLKPNKKYLNAIEGIGRESVFYGYNADDQATPEDARKYINRYLTACPDQRKNSNGH
ncbi:MAG: hypothetical protein U5K69_26705 [Balneolaceae bacterium]|nr:hypothetical protein [Balneolaceae bacterium]